MHIVYGSHRSYIQKNVKLLPDSINYNDSFWESSTISQYKES